MRTKKSKTSKSPSPLKLSFNTGNLLSHPCGIDTFREKSEQQRQRKKQRNDILMLNKSPQFTQKQRYSDEIESDIQNVESQIKLYQKTTLCSKMNGKIKFTTIFQRRYGQEYSQLNDDESTQASSNLLSRNLANPEQAEQKQSKIQDQMKESIKGAKEHIFTERPSNLFANPFLSRQQSNSSSWNNQFQEQEVDYYDGPPADPEFLDYLENIRNNKNI